MSEKELVLGLGPDGGISGHEGCMAEIHRRDLEIERLQKLEMPPDMVVRFAEAKAYTDEIERLTRELDRRDAQLLETNRRKQVYFDALTRIAGEPAQYYAAIAREALTSVREATAEGVLRGEK